MYRSIIFPNNSELFPLLPQHEAGTADLSGHQPKSHLRIAVSREGSQNTKIQQAVHSTGPRSNIGVVPILGSIGNANQKCTLEDGTVAGCDHVIARDRKSTRLTSSH